MFGWVTLYFAGLVGFVLGLLAASMCALAKKEEP